jgi:8-amino-7-oxononanoate synthase
MDESIQIADGLKRRITLQENIDFFRSKMPSSQLMSALNSPVQFIRFAEVTKLKQVEAKAKENKLFIKAIFPPTVQEGDEGLRISLHSFNSTSEIEELLRIISI